VLYGAGSSNQPPPAPVLLEPAAGATVGSQPTLVVENSFDPDGPGPVTYGFRVYADALATTLVASVDGIAEQAGTTSWTTAPLDAGTYWWRAYAADPTEFGRLGETREFTVDDLSGVGDRISHLSLTALGPVAGGTARLQLVLPSSAEVKLTLYDARGAVVRELFAGAMQPGQQVLSWDGRDGGGRSVASGVYFAHVQVGERELTERLLLIR
jgi:hypothetical protein